VFASGWETAGKILTGYFVFDILHNIHQEHNCEHKCKNNKHHKYSYPEVQEVWVPGHWEYKTVHDVIPGGYQTIKVVKEDGSYYYTEEYVPPTIIERTIKIWVEGHWEYKERR